jgi:hypothetical protein
VQPLCYLLPVKKISRNAAVLSILAGALLVLVPGAAQAPKQPLEEIVQHFAQKEEEYAAAHALYQYRLRIRIQEIDKEGSVLGEFEQVSEVGFDRSGRRVARLAANPRTDLLHLSIQRLELEDLSRVSLFVIHPEQIPDYTITYVTRERLDEVDTYLFRLQPKRPAHGRESFFDGIVWVDAQQLDIVRVHGRSLPARGVGPLGKYFQRLEIFREPVDDYLFPTYVRADDVITAAGGQTVRARLIIRFTNHERVRDPSPPSPEP